MDLRFIKCDNNVTNLVSKLVSRIEDVLDDDTTIVVTSSIDTLKILMRSSVVTPYVVLEMDIPDELPYAVPLVKGFYVVYVPRSLSNPSTVIHELSHIVVYDRVNYNVVLALDLERRPDPSLLSAFSTIDSFIVSPLKDALADAVAVKLYPEYVKYLEEEDRVSREICEKERDTPRAILHRLLLIAHSKLTRYSIVDDDLARIREEFSATLRRDKAFELVRYMIDKYVAKYIERYGFAIKEISPCSELATGFYMELVVIEKKAGNT